MASDAEIEAAARKIAGQYQVDDGYGEAARESAERGEMWRNFKAAAKVALEAAEKVRAGDPWHTIETAPADEPVMTKIDDERGCRNEQVMTRRGRFWWIDVGKPVYYTPTHWKRVA